MNPKAVALTGNDVGQIAMPTKARCLREVATCLFSLFIEQTEFKSLGYFGKN
jgi:hypothetical protein